MLFRIPLLIATMTLESFIPAKCWIAPEIPTAIYNSGATTFPVYPTYWSFAAYPASTAALEAPIAVFPKALAKSSRILKFSLLPKPLPPETIYYEIKNYKFSCS